MEIYFYTSGCKVNQYETQVLREQLCANGNVLTENIKEADVCIINSCTVTHNADADCRQVARRCIRINPNARVIVTGCYAVSSPEEIRKISPKIEVIPDKLSVAPNSELRTINSFHKHSRAFVKIQDGCDAFCSYCIVPYVRPKLWSKPKDVLFKEIAALVKNGYKEIVLCGIRLGKYKIPQGENNKKYRLTDLIKDVLTEFKDLKIHFSSFEIGEITDELIEIMKNTDRIVRHLHIPLQSGDDEILKRMKRPYTTEEFEKRNEFIRSKLSDIRITTDVIVGFPGETEKQFKNTVEFIKRNKFSKLHIFRYSPRKGTPASELPNKVDPSKIKNRAKLLLNS